VYVRLRGGYLIFTNLPSCSNYNYNKLQGNQELLAALA
jgi:hypothetical protein